MSTEPPTVAFGMSTDLPYIEGHIDALANTIWWALELKFGRLAHARTGLRPNFFTVVINWFRRIWDSVAIRLVLAVVLPYILHYILDIQNPSQLALGFLIVSLISPWIYQIFIYNPFLDP